MELLVFVYEQLLDSVIEQLVEDSSLEQELTTGHFFAFSGTASGWLWLEITFTLRALLNCPISSVLTIFACCSAVSIKKRRSRADNWKWHVSGL